MIYLNNYVNWASIKNFVSFSVAFYLILNRLRVQQDWY